MSTNPEIALRYGRYPAYKYSGVEWLGEVPEHWGVRALKRSVRRRTEFGTDPSLRIALENLASWTGAFLPSESDYQAKGTGFLAGDVLFGKLRPYLAKAFLADSDGVAVGDFFVMSSSHELWPPYLLSWVLSDHFVKVVDASTFGAKMPRASWDYVSGLPLVVPPLPEQHAIASFLDRKTAEIDTLVVKKERLLELLTEKRTALITRAVTVGLNPTTKLTTTESAIFPSVPVSWEMHKIRRVLRRRVRPIQLSAEDLYREIGIRSWGKGIFHKKPIKGVLLGDKRVFRIVPGDFVLNIVFAWEGAVAVVSPHEEGMIASHRFPTFRISEEVDLDYLLMIFQTAKGRSLMEINSPGAAGRNKTLRLGQFLDELIPIPAIDQQRATVLAVRKEETRLRSLTIKLVDAIDCLKEYRKALISAAVTGKIDVREEA